MGKVRLVSITLLTALILFLGRESQAVIYKYINEKGVPTFADDMQKVPEEYRAQAVIVSGVVADEKAEEERARLAAEALNRQDQRFSAPTREEEPVSKRLIRSGVGVGLFLVLLFVSYHIDALREQAQVLSRVRTALVALLFMFIVFTHARDVVGLFGRVGDTVSNPVAGLQERSAERGKKAAEAYKSIDKVLDQRAHDEGARLQETDRKFDEAERGK